MSLGGGSSPKPPPPPPNFATSADASVVAVGERAASGFTSLVSTSPSGIITRARTGRRSLLGGAQ